MPRFLFLSLCLGIILCGWGNVGAAGPKKELVHEGKPLSQWIAQLKDKDPKARRAAAQALGRVYPRSKPAIAALADALHDLDAGVRLDAANAFWQSQRNRDVSDEVIPIALEAMKHSDSEIRGQAAGFLRQFTYNGPKAVLDALTKALDDKDVGVRVQAAIAFWHAPPPRTTDVLLEAFQGKYPSEIRQAAAEALGQQGWLARSTIPVLRAALKDEDSVVRVYAAAALWHVGGELKWSGPLLIEALGEQDVNVRRKVAITIAHTLEFAHHRRFIPGEGEEDEAGRQVDSFLQVAAPALVEILNDKDRIVRWNALRALSGIGPKAKMAAPALIELLKSKEENVAGQAAGALGSLGFDQVPALVKLLEDPDKDVRQGAVYALRSAYYYSCQKEAEHSTVIQALTAALNHKDRRIRRSAAEELIDLGQHTPQTLGAMRENLKDMDVSVRQMAAHTLERIGPAAKEAIPDLLQGLKDPDGQVRIAAAAAVWKVAKRSTEILPVLLKALQEDESGSFPVCQTLGEIGPAARAAVPRLIELLRDEGSRHYVVTALAGIAQGDEAERLSRTLIELVRGKDKELRLGAVEAIAGLRLEEEKLHAILLDLLKSDDPDVRETVITNLGRRRNQGEQVLPALKRLEKEDADRHVRAAAARKRQQIEEEIEREKPRREMEKRMKEMRKQFEKHMPGSGR
jgi:HEAT repeat protein